MVACIRLSGLLLLIMRWFDGCGVGGGGCNDGIASRRVVQSCIALQASLATDVGEEIHWTITGQIEEPCARSRKNVK